MDIEKTVWNIVTDPLKGMGYNLIRVKMIRSKKLQIMAERFSDKSLDINDCVKISKFISVLLEKESSVKEIVDQGFDKELVKRIQNLLYNSEYKRRQAAPGVKISERNFGYDRRYPITNAFRDMEN